MEVNYKFVPQYESHAIKHKSDIISYAGKLLEIVGSPLLIVGLNDNNEPFVWECSDRFSDALDFNLETY